MHDDEADVRAAAVAALGNIDDDRAVLSLIRALGDPVRVERREEPCAPCFRPDCELGLVCLTRIEVDEVFRACRELLEIK